MAFDFRRLRPGAFTRTPLALPKEDTAPPHPGAVLRDKALPASRVSRTEMARIMGITTLQLRAILNETKPITPEIAACLGKMFGNGPGAWIAMQAAYDEWVAVHDVDVAHVPALSAPLLALVQDDRQDRPSDNRGMLLLMGAGCVVLLMVVIGMVFVALLPLFLGAAFVAGGATFALLQRRFAGRIGLRRFK